MGVLGSAIGCILAKGGGCAAEDGKLVALTIAVLILGSDNEGRRVEETDSCRTMGFTGCDSATAGFGTSPAVGGTKEGPEAEGRALVARADVEGTKAVAVGFNTGRGIGIGFVPFGSELVLGCMGGCIAPSKTSLCDFMNSRGVACCRFNTTKTNNMLGLTAAGAFFAPKTEGNAEEVRVVRGVAAAPNAAPPKTFVVPNVASELAILEKAD